MSGQGCIFAKAEFNYFYFFLFALKMPKRLAHAQNGSPVMAAVV